MNLKQIVLDRLSMFQCKKISKILQKRVYIYSNLDDNISCYPNLHHSRLGELLKRFRTPNGYLIFSFVLERPFIDIREYLSYSVKLDSRNYKS